MKIKLDIINQNEERKKKKPILIIIGSILTILLIILFEDFFGNMFMILFVGAFFTFIIGFFLAFNWPNEMKIGELILSTESIEILTSKETIIKKNEINMVIFYEEPKFLGFHNSMHQGMINGRLLDGRSNFLYIETNIDRYFINIYVPNQQRYNKIYKIIQESEYNIQKENVPNVESIGELIEKHNITNVFP